MIVIDIDQRAKTTLETIGHPSYDLDAMSQANVTQCPVTCCIGFIMQPT